MIALRQMGVQDETRPGLPGQIGVGLIRPGSTGVSAPRPAGMPMVQSPMTPSVQPPAARPNIASATPTGLNVTPGIPAPTPGPTFQPGQRPPAPPPAPAAAPAPQPTLATLPTTATTGASGVGAGAAAGMPMIQSPATPASAPVRPAWAPPPTLPTAAIRPPTGGTGTATGGPAIQPGQNGGGSIVPTPALPPTAPAAAPAATGGIPTTAIDPANDLRSQQVLPSADPRLAGASAATDAAASALSGGPNRTELAMKTLADFDRAGARGLSDRFTNIGQQAAKFGRIGHGENETAVKDAQLQYETNRDILKNQLASSVAEGDIADRFSKVGTLSGLEGSIYGQGAANRGEVRTERDYQTGAAEQATSRAVEQRRLEEELANSAFSREATKAGYAGDLGRVQAGLGAEHAAAAGQAGSDIGALLAAYTASRAPKAGLPTSGAQPAGTTANDSIDIESILRQLGIGAPGVMVG